IFFSFLLLLRRQPISTLFPYTTLFRSNGAWYDFQLKIARKLIFSKWREALGGELNLIVSGSAALQPRLARVFAAAQLPVIEGYRSEEHTSELQSRENLVCRLLLEKKKK